jgi:hypothetical protein
LLACGTAHLLFLAVYAMRMGPHESSENNGYGNIIALPVIGLLVVAAVFIGCLYPRHVPMKSGAVRAIAFVVLYSIAGIVIYNLPVLYGGYTARFKLVDINGEPLSGMRVEFTQQRTGSSIASFLISVFFVQDYMTVDYSDKKGIARAPANINTRLSAFINLTPDRSAPLNPNYFIGDVLLVEQMNTPSLTGSLMPSWTDQQKTQSISSQVAIPSHQPILITVPNRFHASTRSK